MNKFKAINIFLFVLFFSVDTFSQSELWNLVMSKGTGYTDQRWKTRTEFPNDEIKKDWDDGYSITDLTYHDGKWAVVMSKGADLGLQRWRKRTYFPEKEIDESWDDGYNITHLTYGNGTWVLVMSKSSSQPAQLWRTRSYFPKDEIKENWDKGYYITDLVYGDGKWALVMTKGTGYTKQAWRTRAYYPKDEIKELWDQGYYITSLTYGNNLWALVMTKGSTYTQQWWRTRTYFPEKEIKELWDKGAYISCLSQGAYENKADVPVVENKPPTIEITEPTVTRGFKVVKVPTTKVEGYARDDDGIASVIINNTTATVSSSGYFYANVPLNDGENIIRVSATDKKGKTGYHSFTLQKSVSQEVVDIPVDVSQKRLALVIGNSAYQHGGTLRNPINDARAMKTALEKLGFTVMKCENCSQNDMKRMIDDFGSKLQNYDVGLFFYAGHGIQVNGNNYLVPVDSKLEYERDVEYNCVQAGRVLGKMESAKSKINLIILDACRDNPFARSWSRSTSSKGLAFMNAPSGSLIAYATSPGNTASDGSGTNGLYTSAILQYIGQSDLQIEDMFKKVRQKVIKDSGGKQTPWESTSLTKDFYFSY
jgi:hypothetical protein